MIPCTFTLLVTLICFTTVNLRAEAAKTTCIRGPPGHDGQPGRDGTPGLNGRDGTPGPPTTLNDIEKQWLKKDILNTLREEICQSNLCNSCKPTCNGMSAQYPAASCKEIYDCDPNSPSGFYWRDSSPDPPELMYCAMNLTYCGSTTGGWMRVAHIDMTRPDGTCPSPLKTIASPRSCSHAGGPGCSSVYFSTFGVPFTKVCGQAIGYQRHSSDAFGAFLTPKEIDRPYVDGLSITYGNSPRTHLWTYAAGVTASGGYPFYPLSSCPCAAAGATQPPSYVADNYYCESGNVGKVEDKWYADDPLWDGDGCPTGNTCCDPPNLPWFNRMINPASTANIELRVCRDEVATNEDVSVEQFELYVY